MDNDDIKDRVLFRLVNHGIIYFDEKGGFRQRFIFPKDVVPKDYKPNLKKLYFGCRGLCNYHKPITRFHLTCFHCRVRRVFEGKHPADFPIIMRVYTIDQAQTRRFCRLKNKLIHYLSSVCEVLAD